MSIEENKHFVKQFLEWIAAGDAEAITSSYHPDGRVTTMGNTLISGTRGVQEIRQFSSGVLDAFPGGLLFTIQSMTAEDDRVAVECEAKGRHVSGADYHQHYHFLFRFRDGKLLELKEYLDTELVTEILCGGQRPA